MKTLANYKLTATQINSLVEFPSDAILVMHSDHYRGNSGDTIFFTDSKGKLMSETASIFFTHWNISADDRGVQYIVALTHSEGRGAFATYMEFRKLCNHYVETSQNLKKWHLDETVWNVNVPEYANNGCGDTKTFVGSKDILKFENSLWYRRVAKRCKPETIARKKEKYIAEQEKFNATVLDVLEKDKTEMKAIFYELGISVRFAYLFKQDYIQ